MTVRDWMASRLVAATNRLVGPDQTRALTLAALNQWGYPTRAGAGRNVPVVNSETALRNSVVWACRRIRADLISTFPVDTYRDVNGVSVEMPKAPVLVEPDGTAWPMHHWMWATQFELDGLGNTVGLITQRNALGLPSRIELVPMAAVSMYRTQKMAEQGTYRYRIYGTEYTPEQIWHDRQFPVPGLPIGLSPIQYAAFDLQTAMSMQQFALDWFSGGAVPKVHLKNTKKSLDPSTNGNQAQTEARRTKDRYQATVANGDVFVSGWDWELDFITAQTMGDEWIQGTQASIPALCRYFGCPVDLVEAAIQAQGSSTITYQNGLQRNLQFLTMHLQPAIFRREASLSALLPRPRYVKLNTNSLLRLDPKAQAEVIHQRLEDRTITNSKARALYDEQPLTQAEIDEFATVYGTRSVAPANAGTQQQDARNLYGDVNPFSAIPYPSEVER